MRCVNDLEIQDCFNFNAPSKVGAGRVIGRCHAALGEHALSAAAFDAAIRHRAGETRALPAVRGAGDPGQGAGGASGRRHWRWKRVALGRARGEAAVSEAMFHASTQIGGPKLQTQNNYNNSNGASGGNMRRVSSYNAARARSPE
jgi:hypothetical protein